MIRDRLKEYYLVVKFVKAPLEPEFKVREHKEHLSLIGMSKCLNAI